MINMQTSFYFEPSSSSSPHLYMHRSTLILYIMLCSVRVKEERQRISPKRSNSTLLQCRYISVQKAATILCYNAGTYQSKRKQQYSATVLVHISTKGSKSTLLQCWSITGEYISKVSQYSTGHTVRSK